MKKIRCNRPISAIKVVDEIINFDKFGTDDKIAVVSDDIAENLLSREGFELVEDISDDSASTSTTQRVTINHQKVTEGAWSFIKQLFGGKK